MYQTSLTRGQELVGQRMVREMRRQGHEAFLITSVFHDGEPVVSAEDVKRRGGFVYLFDRELRIPVIRLASGGAPSPPRRITFEDFAGSLSKLVSELDLNVLIALSTLWDGPTEVVKFAKWRKTMITGGAPYQPFVFAYMGFIQEPFDPRNDLAERSYRDSWNATALSRITAEADMILVATPREEDYMRGLGVPKEKIVLFPGGIEEEAFISLGGAEAFKAEHSLSNGDKLVSYLGTVEERKNPIAILEVAKTLEEKREVRFVIAGKLEGDYGARMNAEASVHPNVLVLGQVSEEEKAWLIRASHVNITMSRAESLGVAQLEFMSGGVPVVTSGAGGQSWIVKSGFNGTVLNGPDDVQGAADAVRRLIDNKSYRNKLAKNASKFALQFSMTTLVDRLSKRLEGELMMLPSGINPAPEIAEEKVIEAWRHDGQSVAATSKRLIIKPASASRKAVEIPYNEIIGITKHVQAAWATLSLGAALSSFLLVQNAIWPGFVGRIFGPLIARVLPLAGLTMVPDGSVIILSLLPLVVCGLVFAVSIREGYLVQYGPAKSRMFVPRSFVKALRLADRLTPNDLFVEGKS